jgi:hypothetical protein
MRCRAPDTRQGTIRTTSFQWPTRTSSLRFPELPLRRYRSPGPRSSRSEDGMLFLRRQRLQTLSFAFGSSFILGAEPTRLSGAVSRTGKLSPLPAGAAVRDGALARWYQQHLGISLTPSSYEDSVWQQDAGPTVFDPQPETSDFFKGTDKLWMCRTFESGISTKWQPSCAPLESRSRLTRSPIPTAGSPACMTLREIRSNCDDLQDQALRARLLNSSGLFLDFSWVTSSSQE